MNFTALLITRPKKNALQVSVGKVESEYRQQVYRLLFQLYRSRPTVYLVVVIDKLEGR